MALLHPDYSQLNHEEMAKNIGLKVKHIPILLSSYLEDAQPICTKIQTAIDANDYDTIREAAHFLKGSSGNMRFNEIYEMAKEIELAAGASNTSFAYTEYVEAISKAISTIKI